VPTKTSGLLWNSTTSDNFTLSQIQSHHSEIKAMTDRLLTIMILLVLTCTTSLAQVTVKGVTPGQSTKTDVVRAFGPPVNKPSETLFEYRPQKLTGKIFVQYQQDSPVVERIEVLCRLEKSTCADFVEEWGLSLGETETVRILEGSNAKYVYYYGRPQYVVTSVDDDGLKGDRAVPFRMAFYSSELYAVAIAKALSELGVTAVESNDAGYEEVMGTVSVRVADGSLKPAAGANINFCWSEIFTCHPSNGSKTNSQGVFSLPVLRGTHVVLVSGPGIRWTYRQGVTVPISSSFALVVESGDGVIPTTRDLENALRKN
jgi:hypothetical protein